MNFFYKQTNAFAIFILLLSFLYLTAAHASIKVIKEQAIKQPITIAVNKTSYPYHAVDKQGNIIGIMPDLWRLWAKKQKVDINFVTLSWLETINQVASGAVDIHAGLSITDSRQQKLSFTKPLFSIYTHFYVNKTLREVDNLSELKPYTIGVIKGSSHIESLSTNHPDLTLKIFNSRHDLYKAALNNEILVFTGLEKLAEDFEGYEVLKQSFPANKVLLNEQSRYSVAVAKGNEKLLRFIETGFDKISTEEQTFIERKWTALGKHTDRILITFPPNYPPYVGVSLLGEPQGMMIDVWRLWSQQVGIPIEFVAQNLTQGLKRVANKKADILTFFPINQTIPNNTVFANPTYEAKGLLFLNQKVRNKGGEPLTAISDLNNRLDGHTFGLWEKTTLKEELLAQYPQLNIKLYPTVGLMLKAAERGEISGMMGLVDLLQAKLEEANIQGLFYRLERPHIITRLAPVIQKDNTKLLQIVNQGFSELDLKELIQIEKKWLQGDTNDSYYIKQASKATLTPSQLAFINTQQTLKLGVVKNLNPVEFVNNNGEFSGINADFVKLISTRTGLKFSIHQFDTWNAAYNAMLTQQIDVLGNVVETQQRQHSMLFSDSYWEMPWGVVHQHSLGRKLQLSEFYGKKVAVVKGIYLIDELRKSHPKINFQVVENRVSAMKALQEERVDGFLISIAAAAHLLRQEENFNLMVSIMEDINSEVSHFAINPQVPELQGIFNKALLTISEKEKQTIFDKWLTFEIKKGLDSSVVWEVSIKVAVVILIILFVILMWNRRLKVEIKYREQLEKKMKHMATHDELTGLANRVLLQDRLTTAISFHDRQSLKLAVLFIDLDGFKNINDTYGHDIGDELLQQVATRFQGCVRSSDTVVRFGGDEFVLLLTGLRSTTEASNVAEKVLNVIQTDFELSKTNASIGCSIGIAMYPDDAGNAIDLVKTSDTLMYKVKESGKNNYMFNS